MLTADDVAERIFAAGLGTIELLSVHLGDRLGLYRALADLGEPTAAEVAARSGVHERYAREWLEQQAVTGLLTARRRRTTRAGSPCRTRPARSLLDPTSLNYLAPLARMFAASAAKLPELLTAYRTGGGVSWDDFGPDARESQAEMNRPWFEQRLAGALAGVPAVHDVLQPAGRPDRRPRLRWRLVQHRARPRLPRATVDGYDVDGPSVDAGHRATPPSPVSPTAPGSTRSTCPAATVGESYDAVFAFECVHDLSAPVEFLATARRATAAGRRHRRDGRGGAAGVHRTGRRARAADVRLLAAGLPAGRHVEPAVGRHRHRDAGGHLASATRRPPDSPTSQVLPVEDFGFFRFYQLR